MVRKTGMSVLAGSALVMGLVTAPALASPDHSNNNSSRKLRAAVSAQGITKHLKKLQAIADANGGTRASGTPGYDKSVKYAVSVFKDAGLKVSVQDFTYRAFTEVSPTELTQISPPPAGPIENIVMEYSGSGDVTAAVTTVANVGCEAADFAGFPAGNIALISRGSCAFADKATNASNAGAVGVVIYNNVPDEDLNGTLSEDFALNIPVTGVTQAVGQNLVATPGLQLRLKADTVREDKTTSNVIAQTKWGNPNNVVMAGAHLDSVNEGPGINDNGSGSATLLEIARQMQKVKPNNQLRFALWGAEEAGLVGSTNYVESLSAEDLDKIALYLNFDMIGSPNYGRFVYDGDDSDATGEQAGPDGSGQIEDVFNKYFADQGLATQGTDFDGRSDYFAFIENDIPAGGLFTGAEEIKTPQQAALFGGTAGVAFDVCYHQACDTLSNVNQQALEEMGDATAHAIITFATSTRDVNGVESHGHHGGGKGWHHGWWHRR